MEEMIMYEQMKIELLEALKNRLPDSFKIITFTVMKGNQEKEAFLITEEDTGASPTFYFADYFSDYCANIPIEQIASKIIGTYYYAMQQVDITVDDFKDFEAQRDKIVYKLVNTKLYKDTLKNIPHIRFFDLSIIFYCVLDINEESCLSYVITNNALDFWGISKKDLYMIAHTNVQKVLPLLVIPSVQAILGEETICSNVKSTVKSLPNDFFYIVTNIFHSNGFANIFTPDLMSTFAERFGDFYILPASTDEALFIPAEAMGINDVNQLIIDINEEISEQGKFLSNSVYKYSSETGKIDAFLN